MTHARPKPVRRTPTPYLLITAALVGGLALAAGSFFYGSVGPQPNGTGVLPNAWVVTPTGLSTEIGDRPLNLATSPDGHFIAVSNNGQGVQSLALYDTYTNRMAQSIPYGAPESLYVGLAWSADGKTLFASAGGNNKIRVYSFDGKTLLEGAPIVLGDSRTPIYPAGLALSSDGKTLYAALNLGNSVAAIDLTGRSSLNVKYLKFGDAASPSGIGTLPYMMVLSSDGKTLYTSHWGAKAVSVVDTATLKVTTLVAVGDHPSGLTLAPDGKTLFVANANSDTVSAIDTSSNSVRGTVALAPYANAPMGSMPDAVSVTPDGKTLLVANGGNNDVAVVDASSLKVTGLVPTAWFPSALTTSSDGKFMFVANMKGLGAGPNPRGPVPGKRNPFEQYIAALGRGSLQAVEIPGSGDLAAYTAQVVKNNGFDEMQAKLTQAPSSTAAQPVPRRVGDASPIKHVLYVLKENRTYDQVFGSLKEGNGDASLELFGPDVTPNQRALALEFGLFDNFYADAEVSADGHNWTMGAIATDYTQKNWPANYSGRNRDYDFEGGSSAPAPTGGYLFDYAKRANLDYRSYGEFNDFASQVPNVKPAAFATSLEGRLSPTYPGYDMSISDQVRFEAWKKEFDAYVGNGKLPQLSVVRLPRDHTNGTRAGSPVPAAYVADNDLALGKLVEAVSNSPYWKDTAIFVLEDDAQNGPDHVDAHRMPALVISAYSKRGTRDHTQYSTSAMLRTIELILGLPPMTQFDAAATPMVAAFQNTPDLKPYKALTPKQPLDQLNTAASYGSAISARLDLSRPDRADELSFNRVIWGSVKGAGVPMPAPVSGMRSAALKSADESYRLSRFKAQAAQKFQAKLLNRVQPLDAGGFGDGK